MTGDTFRLLGGTWRRHVVDDGHRYEWRTVGGRCSAGRETGRGTYWAEADGRVIGEGFPSLRDAMIAATHAAMARRAA